MAKTQLLADMVKYSSNASAMMLTLSQQLTGEDLTFEHRKLLTNIGAELEKLGQCVTKMKTKIAGWDGSPKLKNAFKDQKKLAAARDDAKKRFLVIETEYNDLNKERQALMNIMAEFGH